MERFRFKVGTLTRNVTNVQIQEEKKEFSLFYQYLEMTENVSKFYTFDNVSFKLAHKDAPQNLL